MAQVELTGLGMGGVEEVKGREESYMVPCADSGSSHWREGSTGRAESQVEEGTEDGNSVLDVLVDIGGQGFHQAAECVDLQWAGTKPQ